MRLLLFISALLAGIPLVAFAMTSTNYGIAWDSVNIGGVDISTSTNYLLRDTVGEHATGISTSTNYEISAGYRGGEAQAPYLALTLGTEEVTSQTTWSAFSSSGLTVEVADASSFAVGEFIVIIEDEGFAQLVAIGKITNITETAITVDAWEGEPASLSATSADDNDYAYRAAGKTASLGMQSIVTENTAVTITDVVSNATNGYTVTVEGLDDFRSGANTLQAVSDGTVTAGSEEYGIESVGTTAAGSGADIAIPVASQQAIQQSSEAASHDRVAVIYKLAVSPATPTGSYTQTIVYRVTGNF